MLDISSEKIKALKILISEGIESGQCIFNWFYECEANKGKRKVCIENLFYSFSLTLCSGITWKGEQCSNTVPNDSIEFCSICSSKGFISLSLQQKELISDFLNSSE